MNPAGVITRSLTGALDTATVKNTNWPACPQIFPTGPGHHPRTSGEAVRPTATRTPNPTPWAIDVGPREETLALWMWAVHNNGVSWREIGQQVGLDQYVYQAWMVEAVWYGAVWSDMRHGRPPRLRDLFRDYHGTQHWESCETCNSGPEGYLHIDRVVALTAWKFMRSPITAAAA